MVRNFNFEEKISEDHNEKEVQKSKDEKPEKKEKSKSQWQKLQLSDSKREYLETKGVHGEEMSLEKELGPMFYWSPRTWTLWWWLHASGGKKLLAFLNDDVCMILYIKARSKRCPGLRSFSFGFDFQHKSAQKTSSAYKFLGVDQ